MTEIWKFATVAGLSIRPVVGGYFGKVIGYSYPVKNVMSNVTLLVTSSNVTYYI